jgi:hypothetical protein
MLVSINRKHPTQKERRKTMIPRPVPTILLVVLFFIQTLPIQAQEEVTVFVLPTASVSNLYRVNIEQILRENYRLKLESSSQTQTFRWYFRSGVLPSGLRLTVDGNIIGTPRVARSEPYRFQVSAVASISRSDELTMRFELKVDPSRIRLVSTGAPRLVPIDFESKETRDGVRLSFGNRVNTISNENHVNSNNSDDSTTVESTNSISRVSNEQRPETASPRYLSTRGNSHVKIADNSADTVLPLPTRSVPATSAPPAAEPASPSCLPVPTPDESKDFIINARTGETWGKKKFRLSDNVRIIVIEKNPFLYEYKITLKDKVIVESAIADFFKGWPLSIEDAKKAEEPAKKTDDKAVASSCSALTENFGDQVYHLNNLQDWLSKNMAPLGASYTTQKDSYEPVAKSVDDDKKVLYDENASCSAVGQKATNIRTTLNHYQPDFESLSKELATFKLYAELFQREVAALIERTRDKAQISDSDACRQVLSAYEASAKGYVLFASEKEAGLEKMKSGNKIFNALVNTINKVFSDPHAFYQVYTRGNYGQPTDVEITVERKDITKEEGKFVKLIDAETINFGGGPRFAIAGGVVVSPFETVNFKRVPALVNGQQTTIIGREESSNSRILPMLMLHGRFAEGKGPISGFHFSLGVTAKPNDNATNVEFLIGPSISFIEERLFFTFGGYAGRQKQLEGNLVLGQELPKEFSDEIPTSTHLVWKPGFALTYKFK